MCFQHQIFNFQILIINLAYQGYLLFGMLAQLFVLELFESFLDEKTFSLPSVSTQRAEEILNKISNNINKTSTGLISVLQGFQKCIA